MGRVEGKVALITGGASGIGRASAELLAAEGARVVIADIDETGGAAVARTIGEAALMMRLDVTSEDDWRAAIAGTLEAFGRLHVLVNSAGVSVLKNVEDTTLEEWRFVNGVNLDGTFLGCKHAIPAIRESGGGAIINLSSVSGLVGGHNLAAYNASKGGVRLLTKSVALHCARKGYNIRCNSVHPTFIDTPILEPILARAEDPELMRQKLARQVPIGRLGRPEEVAAGILYLASDESAFMTGAEFVLDGGITAM
ncbi:MAG: glucose 1-dehydrogenase [Alphaproteobacteria bacterium]